jgi:CHAD domain-containing protein
VLGATSRVVARLRDLDVLIGDIVTSAFGADAPPGAPDLIACLEDERTSVRVEVAADLSSEAAQELRHSLALLPERCATPRAADAALARQRKAAHRDLRKRWRHFSARARELPSLPIEDLHEARKCLKALRYALQCFAPVLNQREVSRFNKHLAHLQDLFGYLNDVDSAKTLVGRLSPAPEHAEMNCAIGFVLGIHVERARKSRGKLATQYEKLAATKLARRWTSPA